MSRNTAVTVVLCVAFLLAAVAPVAFPSRTGCYWPGTEPWEQSLTGIDASASASVPKVRREARVIDALPAPRESTVPPTVAPSVTPRSDDSPARGVGEWRTARASWYGPGFYTPGNRTANGTPFTPDTWCVAHKSMPFGTMLELEYGGTTVTVPVLDRGPYVGDREFDLSEAVARALGFTGVQTIRCWWLKPVVAG
jgi:rare lipoprotein A (peptidoglycan hydrolase)